MACSSDSKPSHRIPTRFQQKVQQNTGDAQQSDIVVIKCSNCNGTGQAFDFDLGMNQMCPYCYNGYHYVRRSAMNGGQVTFTGGSHPCTICRSEYCSDYRGRKETGAHCQNSNCSHTWEQHVW